ncbi:Signal transduction histidine kinase [Pustulibacterium marinum]|uniref:histidine kinase n=1 Tax=Pustulibacterium marinum TaxID=1224947 RepID=A0A1I7ESX3_9FLAO|nr:sensor histidine kinase [Pustulibacterium marinum]SFU27011.1 Signal transduction histidine kinase [Pustulibacterium marinum]
MISFFISLQTNNSDTDFLWIIVSSVMMLLLMSLSLVLFFFISRRKIIQKEVEKQQLTLDHQKEMIHSGIETQEEERKRIAQDLHDDISSKLNVVSLNAQYLLEENLTKEEQHQMLQQVLQITNGTLETSRKIAHNLLPPILDKFGLGAAVDEICEEYDNSKKVSVRFSNQYQENFLTSQQELHLFRVVQELLNNSLKHGKATEISLSITTNEQNLTLRYVDNGKGFDTQNETLKKGLGLRNIDTRLDLLNGNVAYNSSVGNGFKATITL